MTSDELQHTSSSSAKDRGAATSEFAARLRLAVTRIYRGMRSHTEGDQISPNQLLLLSTVARLGPVTLGHLAKAESLAPPTITRLIDVLEASGFVARMASKVDGRHVVVAATAAGRQQMEESRSRRDHWLARRLEELSQEHLNQLMSAIDALDAVGTETSAHVQS